MFEMLLRHFWVVFLAVTFAKYLAARQRIRAAADLSAEEKQSGETCAKWFAMFSAIPWVIMGWGMVVGGLPSMFSYMRPQDGNPYVVIWVCTVLALTMIFAGWVLFAGGARKVRIYQLSNVNVFGRSVPMPETFIKIMAALGPFFILIWIWLMMKLDIPALPLH
jgi:hypothetical protein